MKLTAQEVLRQLLYAMLLVGMVAGARYFVFRPRDLAEVKMRAQIEAKQRQLQKLNRATASIGDLKEEIAELSKAIEFFESKLPTEKEIDKVLEEVWRLAEANNLTTKSICTMAKRSRSVFVQAASPHAEQPIKMQFEGDFQGFYRFLLALENQPRIMRICQLTLGERKGQQGSVTADLEISIFFEAQDAKTCSRKT